MSLETIDKLCFRLIEQSQVQDSGFAIVLHGGEPLLLGYDLLRHLITKLRASLEPVKYPISLQTNGSLLNKQLLDMFSKFRVSVSVSIDGPQEANDIGRIDHKKASTFYRTVSGIDALSAHPDRDFLFAGTLSVIQPMIPAEKIYDFLKNLGSPNMDFLFQDGNHDNLPHGKNSINSTEYGSWLCKLFDCYMIDQEPVPIRLFDDLIRLMMGEPSIKEGRGIDPYGILIIETDGEIRKNDTLRSSFNGADFFSERWNIRFKTLADVIETDEFITYSSLQIPTSNECSQCDYLDICGGGMPLYRWSEERGYNSPSVYCRDHIKLIDKISSRLKSENFA